MIVKLANGELRDEINYSLVFKGNIQYLQCFDPILKETQYSYMFNEKTSYRIKNLEIITIVPTSIIIEGYPLDEKPKALLKISSSSNRVFDVNDLDIGPLQLFQLRCESTDANQEIFVCINGLLRRPVS